MKKLENYIKYYNLFSFLYIRYFQKRNVSLLGVYKFSIKCAEADRAGGSWMDIFDGMMWICTFIFGLFAIGCIRTVLW